MSAEKSNELLPLGTKVKIKEGSYKDRIGEIVVVRKTGGLAGFSFDYCLWIIGVGNVDQKVSTVVAVKTATLYAYKDNKDEVHWITKQYSEAQAKRSKLTRSLEFDKKIDLE